jgi:hypothetical protein
MIGARRILGLMDPEVAVRVVPSLIGALRILGRRKTEVVGVVHGNVPSGMFGILNDRFLDT